MLGIIVAIRNFFLAVILAWIGMEILPSDRQKDAPPSQEPVESLSLF